MTIKTSIIAAIAENNVIGKDNDLLWHIPADFKHFKATTMSKPMVMGRKTFESLPGLLPGRAHIIISRSGFEAEGAHSADSLENGIKIAKKIAEENGQDEIFIIGGAQIYAQSLALADRLVITHVHRAYDGDAFFPDIDMKQWVVQSEEPHEAASDKPAFTIKTYIKAS